MSDEIFSLLAFRKLKNSYSINVILNSTLPMNITCEMLSKLPIDVSLGIYPIGEFADGSFISIDEYQSLVFNAVKKETLCWVEKL